MSRRGVYGSRKAKTGGPMANGQAACSGCTPKRKTIWQRLAMVGVAAFGAWFTGLSGWWTRPALRRPSRE